MNARPNQIAMMQIMKKYSCPLFIVLLILIGLAISPITIFAQNIPEPQGVCAGCDRTFDQIKTIGHAKGCPYEPKQPAPGSTDSEAQMMESMLQPLFNDFFRSLFALPDNSPQKKVGQQEVQRKKEEDIKRQNAIQKWADIQNEAALKRKTEEDARKKQGEKLLSQMQTVGSQGKLPLLSVGSPESDPKLLSMGNYPTAHFSAWERLLGSAYFSGLASRSTKDIDVRFYADQAQRVMSGEPTYVECKIPRVSNEKIAKKVEEVKELYNGMKVKIDGLRVIENRILESKVKIKNAESKKEDATTKLNELQTRITTARPEEKTEVDDLLAQAQEQLQNAEQELNQAKQSESDDLAKKQQLTNEIKSIQSQMQTKIQAEAKQ